MHRRRKRDYCDGLWQFVTPDSQIPPLQRASAFVLMTQAQTLAGMQTAVAPHAVPSMVIPVASIPLLPNGKVMREALRAAGDTAAASAKPEAALPRRSAVSLIRAGLEDKILEVWRDVLGLRHLSVMDDFFSRGGHSLNAFRARARLAEFAPGITVSDIFKHRTAADLAAALESGAEAGGGRRELNGKMPGGHSATTLRIRANRALMPASPDIECGVVGAATDVPGSDDDGGDDDAQRCVLRNCMWLWSLVRGEPVP